MGLEKSRPIYFASLIGILSIKVTMTAFPTTRYPLPRNIVEVRVFNDENKTHHWMNAYPGRIQQFFEFALANREQKFQADPMPGVSGPATLALELIFVNVPPHFPLISLINHLRDEQQHYCTEFPNPTFTFEELEYALVNWVAKGAPSDDSTGNS